MLSGHADRAEALFLQGYNCCQSVFGAFSDVMGLPLPVCLRIACSHGGGIGRLREFCGALSGAEMVLGMLYGYDSPETGAIKAEHYARVQQLAAAFREQYGSTLCRELLGLSGASDPTPTPRTEAFYRERPCLGFVRFCAQMMENFIESTPFSEKNAGI